MAATPDGVQGRVEEVRVGKRHVAGAHRDQLVDVAHYDGLIHDTNPAVVHDRQGQCRHRCEQPRVASTAPASRSSPFTANRAYRSSGGNRWRSGTRPMTWVS